AACHQAEAAELLLQRGADLLAVNTLGEGYDLVHIPKRSTPLHVAAAQNSLPCALVLLRHYHERLASPSYPDPRRKLDVLGRAPYKVARARGNCGLIAEVIHPAANLAAMFGGGSLRGGTAAAARGVPRLAVLAGAEVRRQLLRDVAAAEAAVTEYQSRCASPAAASSAAAAANTFTSSSSAFASVSASAFPPSAFASGPPASGIPEQLLMLPPHLQPHLQHMQQQQQSPFQRASEPPPDGPPVPALLPPSQAHTPLLQQQGGQGEGIQQHGVRGEGGQGQGWRPHLSTVVSESLEEVSSGALLTGGRTQSRDVGLLGAGQQQQQQGLQGQEQGEGQEQGQGVQGCAAVVAGAPHRRSLPRSLSASDLQQRQQQHWPTPQDCQPQQQQREPQGEHQQHLMRPLLHPQRSYPVARTPQRRRQQQQTPAGAQGQQERQQQQQQEIEAAVQADGADGVSYGRVAPLQHQHAAQHQQQPLAPQAVELELNLTPCAALQPDQQLQQQQGQEEQQPQQRQQEQQQQQPQPQPPAPECCKVRATSPFVRRSCGFVENQFARAPLQPMSCCVVCLEDAVCLVAQPCHHRLCAGCARDVVGRWGATAPLQCPMCRAVVGQFTSPVC
ncbi:hypothetical protein Agub_g8422, partial [Astrephomene gubernaculifera]